MPLRRALAFSFGLTAVSLFAALPRLSAQATGELRGTVTDEAGAPIPAALVEVTSVVLIRARQTGSDDAGRFVFPLLPPGSYSVLARMTGFPDGVSPDVRVPLGETASTTIRLPLNATASITVTDEAPIIDTRKARVGVSATAQLLSSLPLGRNFASAASLLGGVGTDILGPTFFGASSLENSFAVDGVNVTGISQGGQGKQLPLEFVQEVEVRSGGYEAEFGRSLGGHINVLTKSGGNEFHGGAFGYYDGRSLSSGDRNSTDRAAALVDRLDIPENFDVGASLGGPLVRDRLWFFGSYDRATSRQGYQGVQSLSYTSNGITQNLADGTDRTETSLFAGTLSWAPSSRHTFSLSIFGDPGSYDGRTTFFGGAVPLPPGPESARVIAREIGGTDLSVHWGGFLGRAMIEAQYGYHEERTRESSDFGGMPQVVEYRSGFGQSTLGSGPGQLVDETDRRSVYRLSASLSLGNHDLRAGAEYGLENPDRSASFTGGDQIFIFLRPDGGFRFARHTYLQKTPFDCTQLTDGRQGHFGLVAVEDCSEWASTPEHRSDFRAHTTSAFVQDSFRALPNLTIHVGLRYDLQDFADSGGFHGLSLSGEWAPRFSVVWDPGGRGRSKIFAAAGRYYQEVPLRLQVYALSEESVAYARNSTRDRPDFVNTIGDSAGIGTTVYLPSGLKGSYQDELLAGAELQLSGSWALSLRGTYRSLGRALEDRCDLYDPSSGLTSLVPTGLTSCALVNPGEGPFGELKDPANPSCFEDFPANQVPRPCETVKASRHYRGLEASVQHRPSKGLYLLASYVYSRFTGTYEGFISGTGGNGVVQTNPSFNADFDVPSTLSNSSGRLQNDRTHQLKVSATYEFPPGLRAGVVGSFSSGAPLSLLGVSPEGYNVFLTPRGSAGEMPSLFRIDLHLEYPVSIGGVSFAPVLDVFNVTNVQRATSRFQVYDTFATREKTASPYTNPTNPLYGKDVAWQPPRLVQLGVRASF